MRINNMTVKQLKPELERRSLPVAGNKKALRERLSAALQNEGSNPDEFEFVLKTSMSEDKEEETLDQQL